MIYDEQALIEKLYAMLSKHEDEVAEFKTASNDYSFKDIGKYFSALSNEANLRSKAEGWLVFGVSNEPKIVGSNYRKDGRGLQNLKKEIQGRTNQKLTFLEIYELTIEGSRVIMFQIPPALPGSPTTWDGSAYGRTGDSLEPLPLYKLDMIRSQSGYDWSKGVVEGASFSDLDPAAVKRARELFIQHSVNRGNEAALFDQLSDEELLNKAGLLLNGQITRTALLLLGDEYAKNYFDGLIPRITWTLYNQDGSVKTYEHFDTPFLLAVDKVFAKIRNVKYRYIARQLTLFPEEVDQYDTNLIKELLHNCIAHQDYTLRGKINVEEFEDRLVFLNEGAFIPETIETALEPGYKPPYYRNPFLVNAMVNMYMIDSNAIGIPRIFEIQKSRFFPLPSYDLSAPNRVRVTVYGKILDPNYTKLLNSDASLDIRTVFLLDKIQKKEPISLEDFQQLKKLGLAEGRYPNIHVSFSVAQAVGQPEDYFKDSGLGDEMSMDYIIRALEKNGPSKKDVLMKLVGSTLPQSMTPDQKSEKFSYLLRRLKRRGKIDCDGKTKGAIWFLTENGLDH